MPYLQRSALMVATKFGIVGEKWLPINCFSPSHGSHLLIGVVAARLGWNAHAHLRDANEDEG